ncbi:MAG TPA: hypothetical protein VN851_07475 [Thermoanaerobaculia bacterium]|nr:hypothetical protein [Thermoanaerobaculia bacterium]
MKLGIWCAKQIGSHLIEKGVDWVVGLALGQEVENEIPNLVAQISRATGPMRALLQENLQADREQLALLKRLKDSQGKKLAEIQADQDRLLRQVEGLAGRMSKLEQQIGRLGSRLDAIDSRLAHLEDALIRECLDLRTSQALGVDEYRIKESPGGWSSDHYEDEHLTLDARLLLNSCSGDLTRRGLLLQLSLVTRELDQDLSLYVNFKGISSYGGQMSLLSRQEIPLARPAYRVDGQVTEIFFPYDEIPDISPTDRIALALVLTHDGEVLYTLPDRVISCVFGQRINCRWGR